MGDEHQSAADGTVEIEEKIRDALAGMRIEITRGLVREQNVGLGHERAREGDALLLAAGQLFRVMRGARREPHLIESLRRAYARVAMAVQLERQHDVLQSREGGDQVEGLEDESHVRAAHPRAPVLIQRREVDAGDEDAAGAGRIEPGKQCQQRRLARTRSAHHGEGLPGSHNDADIGENGERALRARHGLGHISGFEYDFMLHRALNRIFVLVILGLAAFAARAETPVILVFGDSISAGYGLPRVEEGWVAMLGAKLKAQGYGDDVVNASVSGETTAGGLARLSRALSIHHPAVVILELGGNDGLRALPIGEMRANLSKMIDLAVAGSKVLLLGMRIPPNYGPQYTEAFAATYADLAREKHVALVPFLLNGVALNPDLMQSDGVHPNQAGQPKLLDSVWTALVPLLKR
jgi:acyl-CoA thioesterase I